MGDHIYEDRFANDVSATRVSDYSVSSTGNPFSLDSKSPDFQRGSGYNSPPVSEILVEDVRHQANAKRDVSGITQPQVELFLLLLLFLYHSFYLIIIINFFHVFSPMNDEFI